MWNPKTDEQLGKGWKRWSKILKPQLPSSLGTSVLGMESAEDPEDGSPSCWGCGHRGNRKQDGCHPHRCTKSKNAPPFPHKTCLPYAHIWICICVCILQSTEEAKFYKGSILLIRSEWQELQKQLRIRFPFTKPQMDFNLKAQCRKQITIVLLGKRNTGRQALLLNQSSHTSKWLVFLMLSTCFGSF